MPHSDPHHQHLLNLNDAPSLPAHTGPLEVRVEGKTVADGTAMAKALLIHDMGSDLQVDRSTITSEQVQPELELFEKTLQEALNNIENDPCFCDPEKAAERDGHKRMKKTMIMAARRNEKIKELIRSHHNICDAIDTVYSDTIALAKDENPTFVTDLQQVRNELILALQGTKCQVLQLLERTQEKYILCAQRLSSESVYAGLRGGGLCGIVTGDYTPGAHAPIVAGAHSIPVLALDKSDIRQIITEGDSLILDGHTGTLYVNPDNNTADRFGHGIVNLTQPEKVSITSPILTPDGIQLHIYSSISSFEDEAAESVEYGSGGLGLIRSEIAYFHSFSCSAKECEAELTEAYRNLFATYQGLPAQIRTFDFAADKSRSIVREILQKELPPATLGKFSTSELIRDYFIAPQIRAILRASVAHHNPRIYFANIGTSERFRKYSGFIEHQKGILQGLGHNFSDRLEVGAMIESVDGIRNVDRIAKAGAKFICIGSNDLLSSVTGADRQSDTMMPCNPTVLEQLKDLKLEDLKRRHNIDVHVCGNLAKPAYVPLLLALGFDRLAALTKEFGMMQEVASSIPAEDRESLLRDVLNEESGDVVRNILVDFYQKRNIDISW